MSLLRCGGDEWQDGNKGWQKDWPWNSGSHESCNGDPQWVHKVAIKACDAIKRFPTNGSCDSRCRSRPAMAWVDRVQLRGAARTGHDRQPSARDRPVESPARRNAIRAVTVPRLAGLPARSPVHQERFHSRALYRAVAGQMHGKSRNGARRAHEALRDSALTWFPSPAESFRGLRDDYRLMFPRTTGVGSGARWRHHPMSRVSRAAIAANVAGSLSILGRVTSR